MIISKQIIPLRLSVPPLCFGSAQHPGEADFNKQNCSLLSLYNSTPSLSGWAKSKPGEGWGRYIMKKNKLLIFP